jgi:hypothetical protein
MRCTWRSEAAGTVAIIISVARLPGVREVIQKVIDDFETWTRALTSTATNGPPYRVNDTLITVEQLIDKYPPARADDTARQELLKAARDGCLIGTLAVNRETWQGLD